MKVRGTIKKVLPTLEGMEKIIIRIRNKRGI